MKNTALALSFLALCGAAASLPAIAGTVYSTGPNATNSMANGWGISNTQSVSDAFTLKNANGITGATFVILTSPGDTVTGVDWSFGTAAFGTDVASGIASTTQTDLGTTGNGYEVEEETISFSNVALLGKTAYYLTLSDAVDGGDFIYWEENDGLSNGYESALLGQVGYTSIGQYDCQFEDSCDLTGGETFTLTNSSVAATPEPSSFLMLGTGLAGIAGIIRRKIRA